MSNASVENNHIEAYEHTVISLAQRMNPLCRPWVRERSCSADGQNWERVGQVTMVNKTPVGGAIGRNVPTPEVNTPFSRRRSTPGTWQISDLVEPEDIVRTLIDPNSAIAQQHVYAAARAIDAEILDAAERAADDGNGGTVAFPAGQIIGDGTAAINYDMVTALREGFDSNNVMPDEQKVVFISPAQQRKLLQLTEATSRDYTTADALRKGYVQNWMGFDWIVHTGLNSPAGGEVHCVAMTKRAIGLQVNEAPTVRVNEESTLSYNWRIYCRLQMGAVRVEDEHIFLLHLSETI